MFARFGPAKECPQRQQAVVIGGRLSPRVTLPLTCTKLIPVDVDRLGSGVQVSAGFQKSPHVVGRLGLGHRLVGRIGSEVRVIASFHIFASRILL